MYVVRQDEFSDGATLATGTGENPMTETNIGIWAAVLVGCGVGVIASIMLQSPVGVLAFLAGALASITLMEVA